MTGSKCRTRLVAAVIGLAGAGFIATGVSAASKWQEGPASGGKASASLYSTNVISTGSRTIDFRPVLTLSCDASRPDVWRQSVRINEPISSGPPVDVTVRINQGAERTESWSLGQKNRALVLDGALGMARIGQASRFRVVWQNGFFGGGGEAVFDVRNAGQVIANLAQSCGVKPPAN